MRILIFGPNWVGDNIMVRPAIAALKKDFPHSHLVFAVRPSVCALWQGDTIVDEVVVLPSVSIFKGAVSWFKLIQTIKSYRFDSVIILPHFFTYALIAFCVGIKIRVGYAVCQRKFLLTKALPYSRSLRGEHMVENYFRLLKDFTVKSRPRHLELKIDDGAFSLTREWLAGVGVQKEDLVIGIGPGAIYGRAKRWPEERYAQLSDELIDQLGAKIIIFTGPSEKNIAKKVAGLMQKKPLIAEPRKNLKETAALIKHCNIFIGNDSGLGHIAAAVKTKVITIFGSTSPLWTKPYTAKAWTIYKKTECSPCFKRKCRFGTYHCLKEIKVGDVLGVTKRVFREDTAEVTAASR